LIEVRLSTTSLHQPIVAFDGRVLEVFRVDSAAGSERVHVGQLKSIQLSLNKKGRHVLEWKTEFHGFREEIAPEAVPLAEELVTAVQRAMKLSI
jgi:hypothetical protein